MNKIKLFNRDHAQLWLIKNSSEKIEKSNIYEWKLTVDPKHKYIFEYCRFIYESGFGSDIIAIDPAGGPMISLGDDLFKDTIYENKYKIVKLNSINSIWISERTDNNKEHTE